MTCSAAEDPSDGRGACAATDEESEEFAEPLFASGSAYKQPICRHHLGEMTDLATAAAVGTGAACVTVKATVTQGSVECIMTRKQGEESLPPTNIAEIAKVRVRMNMGATIIVVEKNSSPLNHRTKEYYRKLGRAGREEEGRRERRIGG